MTDINWHAIREDYETSRLSLRSLAAKYGVKLTTLHDRIKSEQWHRTLGEQRTPPPVQQPAASRGIRGLADRMVTRLETIAEDNLTLLEVKLLADSLSQFNKIKITAPVEQDASMTGPQRMIHPDVLRHMTLQEKNELETLLKTAEDRALAEEQQQEKLKRA